MAGWVDRWLSGSWRGRPVAVWVLVLLLCFLGVRGVIGGVQFLVEPSGALAGLSPAELSGTPFGDYVVPGAILLVVLGIAPLVAATGLLRRTPWAIVAILGVSVGLTVWIVVEAAVIGVGERLQSLNLLLALVLFEIGRSPTVGEYVDGGS